MSILSYLCAFGWGFVLLAGFAGWGFIVGRAYREHEATDWGLAIARGISGLVVIGGVLNLCRAIGPASVLALVVVGLAGLVALGPPIPGRGAWGRVRSAGPLAWIVAGLALVGYVNWLYCPAAGPHTSYNLSSSDDLPGYVVYPTRMLQTGSIGDDPFNDRRSSSALGGHSFLQTFVLAIFPPEYLHLLDPGLAYLAMGAMLFAMGPGPGVAAALLALDLSLPTDSTNASAIGLPTILLLASFRESLRDDAREPPLLAASRLALPLAAAVSLKSTLAPGAVAIGGLLMACRAVAEGKVVANALRGLAVAALVVLFLLPWMVDMFPSAGTYFYPFLGEGYRANSPYIMPHRTYTRSGPEFARQTLWLLRVPRILACYLGAALAAAALVLLPHGRAERVAHLASFGGAVSTMILYTIIFTYMQFMRYSHNLITLVLLLAFRVFLGGPFEGLGPGPRSALRRGAACALAAIALGGAYRDIQHSRGWWGVVRAAWRGEGGVPAGEVACYRSLQEAVPPSAKVLVHLPKPFLFDFRRQRFFVIDTPGAVSPPPGMPLRADGEAVARYLRAQGIRYVACRHPLPRGLGPIDESLRDIDLWLVSVHETSDLLLRRLAELDDAYETIHLNPLIKVIDLNRPARGAP
jgi:hypothetical protein